MKYSFLLAAILVLFSFCSQSNKVPEDILPSDRMEAIILDLNLVEGAVKHQNLLIDSSKKVIPKYYAEVFKKHSISRGDFMKSYDYYLKHPAAFEKVHEEVLEELSKKESGLD